jgi:aspartate aminotransferase
LKLQFRNEIGVSLTLQFAEAANARRASGQPILSLGLGEPDFDTPPELIEAVTTVLKRGNSGYSNPLGVLQLRGKIRDKLAIDNQICCSEQSILVTAGAKHALSIVLMSMLEPGDEVIVVSPHFVSFVPQIYMAEPTAVVHTVHVDKKSHALPFEQISALVNKRTKALLINSPNNPAGYVSLRSELQQLHELAEEKDFYIISDEVYEKLILGVDEHVSIGSFEPEPKRVVTINGFSKSHALTGWRIGYCTLPQELKVRAVKIQQHMNTNTCTFVQQALAESWDPAKDYLGSYNAKLAGRLSRVENWLIGTQGLSAKLPSAGFFAFIDISKLGVASNQFCAQLLESTGVATTPGLAFGNDWDDHFRLSFAVQDEVLDEALVRIAAHTRDYLV